MDDLTNPHRGSSFDDFLKEEGILEECTEAAKLELCPQCQTECYRESVHVGVGIMYGPWGCPKCGWSEDERYDLRSGSKATEKGYRLDQFGGATPPQLQDSIKETDNG